MYVQLQDTHAFGLLFIGLYSLRLSPHTSPYFFTNFGRKRPEGSYPHVIWTSTWPEQPLPAPMQYRMESFFVIRVATSAGTASSTRRNIQLPGLLEHLQVPSLRLRPSSLVPGIHESILPLRSKSTWPRTGIPALVIFLMVGAISAPPSNLILCTRPSLMNRIADSKACSGRSRMIPWQISNLEKEVSLMPESVPGKVAYCESCLAARATERSEVASPPATLRWYHPFLELPWQDCLRQELSHASRITGVATGKVVCRNHGYCSPFLYKVRMVLRVTFFLRLAVADPSENESFSCSDIGKERLHCK